ncbi:MAG: methylenetetrahydrofolate reductase C-terminal domain-containing protein [Candidatus Omnitrophota bacterium]
MIVTKRKPLSEILDNIIKDKNIFLIGCSLCATTCKTGGEDQVREIAKLLKENGKKVTGWAVLDPACNGIVIKRFSRERKKELDESDAVLSLACGGGTQAVFNGLKRKKVYPANDTLFQGDAARITLKEAEFGQKCSLCGECVLAVTGGICPVTRCAKGLVNGPCGGIKNGKCEVDDTLDCAWLLIYDRLKELDQLNEMEKIRQPKDHSKSRKPQNLVVK